MEKQGTIIRAMSGFYDVDTGTETIRCRARGKFRNDGLMPLVGDIVRFSMSGSEGYLGQILPRKNSFIRPAVANLDILVMMAANVNPITDPFLIDRVGAIAAQQEVELIIVLNKCDLDPAEKLYNIYKDTGMTVLRLSAVTGEGIEPLRKVILGKFCAFTGNSGVGKSTLLNRLYPEAHMPTDEVSKKLGRGRHTTRHVELFTLPDGTKIMDTPGFSAFDTDQMELGDPAQLVLAFPEFAPYLGKCRFDDCAHIQEKGCAILSALEAGKIQPSRHKSYVRLYQAAKENQSWERKKG